MIGFMGSGKSHWGRLLSKRLELPYYDLDEEITKAENRSIPQIFHDDGEEYFRFKEKEMLEALVEDHEMFIISCGGGTPCFFNNIDFMKRSGTVVWLNTSIETLVQRLQREKQTRPLIKAISDKELRSYIIKKLQDRRLYYEQATVIVPEETIVTDTLIKAIQDA